LLLVSIFFPPIMPIVMGVVITSLALFAAAATAIFVPILLLNTYAAVYELSHLHDFILLDKAKAVRQDLLRVKSQLELLFFDHPENEDVSRYIDAYKYSDNPRLVKLSFLYDAIDSSLVAWPNTVSVSNLDKSKISYRSDLRRSKQWLIDFEESLITNITKADMVVPSLTYVGESATPRPIEPLLSSGVYVHEALNRLPLINVVYRLVRAPLRMLGLVSKGVKLDSAGEANDISRILCCDHESAYPFAVYDYWLAYIHERINVMDENDRVFIDNLRNAVVKQSDVLESCSQLMRNCKKQSAMYERLKSLECVLKSYISLDMAKLKGVSQELEKCQGVSMQGPAHELEKDLLFLSCALLDDDCQVLGNNKVDATKISKTLDIGALQKSFAALQVQKDKVVLDKNKKQLDLTKGKPFQSVLSVLKPKPPTNQG